MGFFLGLLSSGQKFHFRSADSCYLRKLACLSRNLLNEQEIKYIYIWISTKLDSVMIRDVFTGALIQILSSGFPYISTSSR